MYLRRGSILLIFLLFIPLAFSFDFQCRDGTLFGKCNEKSEICANGPNLIFRENVNLEESENYLFFSEVNSDCNVYELNLSSVVRLDKTDKTLVKEFSLNDSYDGKVRLLCDGFEIPLGNAYIGKLNNEIGLYNDIYYCGISQDFLDSFQKYLNANGEEREKLKEEMRDKFGLSSSYFRSITGNVVAEGKCVDFVENGRVDYDDFFLFSDNFGLTSENENFEDKFDLDSDNIISVEDFFIFADEFGNEVECEEVSNTLVMCDEFPEGEYHTIICPGNGKIKNILRSDLVNFDSDASCGNEITSSSCKAYCNYLDVFDCIGKNNCEIYVNLFYCGLVGNDPCPGVYKKLITEYECEGLEETPQELSNEYYRFTFENWQTEDIPELMNYLCGVYDWYEINSVYQCNFNNGNELDGAYELAINIYGEPFDGNDKQINIVRDDSQRYSGFDGFTNTIIISLLSNIYGIEPAKFILIHELLHSFRFSFDSSSFYDLYAEGYVEGTSHIIRNKLRELGSYMPEWNEHRLYSIFNDEAIITNNGAFHYEFSPITGMQYQIGAYVWLELYAQDKNFFKKFNLRLKEELDKNPEFKNDLFNLNELVKEVITNVDGMTIDEWMHRNYIFSSSGKKGIFGFLFGIANEFTLLNRNGILTQPSNPDDFNVMLKIYDYNNNLIFESEMDEEDKRVFNLGSPDYYWMIGSNIDSSFGRYKKVATAESAGSIIYSDFYWLPLPFDNIISGVVVPYNEGTVRLIPEGKNEVVLDVNNGAFGTNSRELKDFEGIIKFEFESPTGDRIIKTVYKEKNIFYNFYVLLTDEPFIFHDPILEIKPSSDFEVTAEVYNSDDVKLYYKYNNQLEYENIVMNNIQGSTYSASISINEDTSNLEYYIIASKSNGASFVYPKDGLIDPINTIISSIPTTQWKPVRVLEHIITNPNYFISLNACRIDDFDLGCGGTIYLNNENNYVLNFDSESVPVIRIWAYPNLIQETEATFIFTEGAITKEITVYLPSTDFIDPDITLELFVASDGSTYWKKNPRLNIDNPLFEDAVANEHIARLADDEFSEKLDELEELL